MGFASKLADLLDPPPLPPELATPAGFAEAHSRGMWRRAPHLDLVERACLDAIETGGRLILSVSVRHGKALDVDTPIATPDGWTTMGALKPGDSVYDEQGQVCAVVHAFAPYLTTDARRVTFSEGTEIVTDAPHKWTAYSYRQAQALGQWRRYNNQPNRAWPTTWGMDIGSSARCADVVTTEGMAEDGGRFYVPNCQPIDTPEVDLPVDPYVLGVWLGDGSSTGNIITAHHDDHPHLRSEFEAAGHTTRLSKAPQAFTVDPTGSGYKSPFGAALRALGVWGNKHVPAVYLRASPAQRLALLRGLMDSDGGVERSLRNTGRVSFTNQTPALVYAVRELFVSLGAKVTVDDRPARCNGALTGATAYRVSSSPPFQPFLLPRKADAWADDSKGSLTRRARAVDSIKPTEPCMVRCITVDSPSSLYLAGESMVPTHNSEFASKWLPAWYLATHPNHRVILVGNEADFASRWGRAARDILTEHGHEFGVRVSQSSSAANRWDLEAPHTGGMLTAGVGGRIIGSGANLLVVDDPIKSYADAMSPLIRSRTREWFSGTAMSRVQPGGAVILIMARWHEDDLAGWLLEQQPETWTELRLPAIADDPADLLGRQVGEALWPEEWPLETLEARRESVSLAVGESVWLAQYQQRPTTPTGGIFPADKWVTAPAVNHGWEPIRWCRGWDLAATEGGGDWTVGALVGITNDQRTIVADIVRGQWSSAEVRQRITDTARTDPPGTLIELPQDPGQAGKDQAQQLVAMLGGYQAHTEPQTGSKEVRAAGFAAQQQARNVTLIDGPWQGAFIVEATGFPRGTHDDQVDAVATAYNALVGMSQRPARVTEYRNTALDGSR